MNKFHKIILVILLIVYIICFSFGGQKGLAIAILLTGIAILFRGINLCATSEKKWTSDSSIHKDDTISEVKRRFYEEHGYYPSDELIEYVYNKLDKKSYVVSGSYMNWRQFAKGIGIIFIGILIGTIGGYSIHEYNTYENILRKPSLNQCDKYLTSKYHFPRFHKKHIQEKMDSLLNYLDLKELVYFTNSADRVSHFKNIAEDIVYKTCNDAYINAKESNTIGAWIFYRDSILRYDKYAPLSEDSINNIISYLKDNVWMEEETAWKNAESIGSLAAYNKYLDLYPDGIHKKEAIDAAVQHIASGKYGELPPMDKYYNEGGPTSYITISNDTQYNLTILYSGIESKRIILQPGERSTISLLNGNYKIAASVNAYDVCNYYGVDELTGQNYSVNYYILKSENNRIPIL